MKSAQLVAPRTIEVQEMPLPADPAPGEVLVKLGSVGICGSDMHWYLEGSIYGLAAVYPQVLGHEPAAEVIAMGSRVTKFRPGQRVSIEPTISCGRCEWCRRGQHNNCPTSRFMGSPQAPGLLREYAIIPAHNATLVPESFSYTQASLIEPVAVIMHMLELVEIRPGDSVAILGAGPMGLLAACVARHAGAAQVLMADKLPHRIGMAQDLVATAAVPMGQFGELVLDRTRGRGVDIAIDAAGAAETINAALAVTRLGGTFALIGIPNHTPVGVDLFSLQAKEIRFLPVKRSNHQSEPAIALLTSGAIPESIVTHRVGLEQAPGAFRMLAEYRDGVGKLAIEFPA
ncbi:MAG TPA: alcohol dehydrogenase catalytic domain-containing protein [Bryobacteraceae bacterium]|nr:alcohol dehydrogenase catalytic domain-containing protein [Bryobacteraceae bacterium]